MSVVPYRELGAAFDVVLEIRNSTGDHTSEEFVYKTACKIFESLTGRSVVTNKPAAPRKSPEELVSSLDKNMARLRKKNKKQIEQKNKDLADAERLVMEGIRIYEEHGGLNVFYSLSTIESLRRDKDEAKKQVEKVRLHYGLEGSK